MAYLRSRLSIKPKVSCVSFPSLVLLDFVRCILFQKLGFSIVSTYPFKISSNISIINISTQSVAPWEEGTSLTTTNKSKRSRCYLVRCHYVTK
jgi:hypothetical protein